MYEEISFEEHDMICRIHRLEDKMLRSKDFQEQLSIRSVLMRYRAQLQKLQWDRQKKTVRAFN